METQLDLKSVKAFLLVLVVALRYKDPTALPPETLETLETQLENFCTPGRVSPKQKEEAMILVSMLRDWVSQSDLSFWDISEEDPH